MTRNKHKQEHTKKENLYEFSVSMLPQQELPCDSVLHRDNISQDAVPNTQDT